MRAAVHVRIPLNSFFAQSILERLENICAEAGIDYRSELIRLHTSAHAPLDITAEAADDDSLALLVEALRKWAITLSKTIIIRFTLKLAATATLIEATGPVAGRGQVLALMADIADSVEILGGAGVMPSVSRILLDPYQRLEALADVGTRAAYIVDLTTRTVRVAGGAGKVPEPLFAKVDSPRNSTL